MALFVVVSFSFKSIYKYIIPLLIVLIIIQVARGLMNKISKETLYSTYFYLLIYSTVFYKSIQTIILISFLFVLVLFFIKEAPRKSLVHIRTELLILIFFGAIFINSIIFEPRFAGIDKYLYLLILPIAFLLIKKLSFRIDMFKALRVFISSIFISSLLLLLINLFDGNISLETNTYFSKYLDLTHVYYGMFIGAAAVLLLVLFKEGKTFINSKFDVVLFIWFLVLLVHIGARSSLLALLIIFVLTLFAKVRWPFLHKILLLIAVVSTFLVIAYHTIPRVKDDITYVKNVYSSVKNDDKADIIHNSWRNMYQRFLVTRYTIDQIKKEPLYGIGLQNVKHRISDQIKKDGYIYFEPLNSHNQYLQVWVGMGVFVFLYFLWMLFNFYKLQSYSLYFLSFFLIIMLTESILVRIKGISLFFLFSLIFSFKENNN